MPASRPNRPLALAAAVLLTAAVAGGLIWWATRSRVPDPAAAAAFAGAHNAAVGRLEAGDPAEAEPLLAELIEAGNGFDAALGLTATAVRNRAVAGVLAVDAVSGSAVPPAERADWLPRATAAVAALTAAEPDEPAGYYLESRLAAAAGDDPRRGAALARAAAAAPDAAWPRLAIFDALGDSRDEELAAAGAAALAEAYRLAPENVWVLLNYAKVAAAAEDSAAADAFAALREQLSPFAAGFNYRQAGGVLPLVDAGKAAARGGDWPAARRNAGRLFNVVKSEEIARADRLDLERHPLDFVRTDFPAAFYDAAGLARVPDPRGGPGAVRPVRRRPRPAGDQRRAGRRGGQFRPARRAGTFDAD